MLETQKIAHAYVLLRFEDMLSDPFGTAERLFQAIGLSPTKLSKLRLKFKRTLKESGAHTTRFGEEGKKYWLSPCDVGELLDSEIDNRQASELDAAFRAAFEREARPVLEDLGYLQPDLNRGRPLPSELHQASGSIGLSGLGNHID